MQIEIAKIDRMDLAELDTVRRVLDLPKRQLCERCEINVSTYSRWMRALRGQPGGSMPRRPTLRSIREALKDEATRQGPGQSPESSEAA